MYISGKGISLFSFIVLFLKICTRNRGARLRPVQDPPPNSKKACVHREPDLVPLYGHYVGLK